ncbi:hypothetical protein K443DRAFT_77205, partial [Laccaria amethystina LaAM-08-1]
DSNEELSAEEKELLALSAGIDDEELAMADEMMAETEEDDRLIDEDLNELDEWIDEVSNKMTDEERLVLAANIRPVSCVLVKLRKLAFALVNSTTLLLPAWKSCLQDLELVIRIMPRDVATHWNSTYDMLNFAVDYRKAIEHIT